MQGDLDKAIVRRYIKLNEAKIQNCYEKQLVRKPTLSQVSCPFIFRHGGG